LDRDSDGFALKDTSVDLMINQSTAIELEIDATLMWPNQDYINSIILTKNIETFRQDTTKTIEIPMSIHINYPEFAKKKAKYPLNV
jgi:hypothetical protein